MKKLAYIAGVALIGMGALASCTLDAINYVEKTPENFPVTAEDATQGLAGIYENLNQVSASPQMSFLYLSMLASDDNLGGGGEGDKLMQAMDMMLNYGIDMTRQFWIDRYQGINRANSLLAGLPNIELEESERAQIEGEAKFMRAFFYYELCSQYGPVPLVLDTEENVPTQFTAAQCWGQILQDLRDAAENMPAVRSTGNQAGHVDKYTAEAMLGRAWLFYTGMYCNGEDLAALTSTNYAPLTEVALPDGTTLTKQDVIDYIDDCVNNSGYSLVPDFRNLWAYTNRCVVEEYPYTAGQNLKWVEDDAGENPESMFAIKYNKLASWSTTIGYGNGYALHYGIRGESQYANIFPFGQGWGAGPVAPNLYNDWRNAEPDDMRRDASIQILAELPNFTRGGGGDWYQETDYFEKKMVPYCARYTDDAGAVQYAPVFEQVMYGADGWINTNLMQTGNIRDLVLIRFADVLLMQSELKEDVSGINRVRARAGLDPIAGYSLEALQNERRWELAFEGVRWNDIRRWHIAAAALERQTNQTIYIDGEATQNIAHGGGYAARYNATAGFAKIPDTEISLANGALAQNPGWSGAETEYTQW